MTLQSFLNKLKTNPESISFQNTMDVIENNYNFSETAFKNGNIYNELGQNSGSCKLFYFAKLNDLSKSNTLSCFGDYYRKDVLENPNGTDHANIRNFIKFGWEGISFKGIALQTK